MAVGRCANPRVNGADRPVLQVAVTVGGAEIPGSPFKVMSDEPVHAKAGGHVGTHAAAEPSGTRRKEPDVHVTIAPTVVHRVASTAAAATTAATKVPATTAAATTTATVEAKTTAATMTAAATTAAGPTEASFARR
jgi:hypothetical protein